MEAGKAVSTGQTEKNRVVFTNPVTLNGETVSSIVMREPTVADMRAVDKQGSTDLEREILMIGRLIGVPGEELDALSVSNYKRLQDKYASFFASVGQAAAR
ncbi:MAG: phage tail assembly protein [bacterium]|nr:phage tail assembly protein [bacterium]